jgi:hypothetical protein
MVSREIDQLILKSRLSARQARRDGGKELITGLMQPYLFPYISYFQLIHTCDIFVIHDDVQYIRQGWINRNRIIVHGREYAFVFSVKHDDHSKNVNDRFYAETFDAESGRLLKNIDQSYSKAPYYAEVRSLLMDIFSSSERNVSRFNALALRRTCHYLGINSEFLLSSELEFDKSLKAELRVLAINNRLGSTHYINPIGGVELYSKTRFQESGIQLSFLKPKLISYEQRRAEFLPGLSIIDVMMNCSRDNIRVMLEDADLI